MSLLSISILLSLILFVNVHSKSIEDIGDRIKHGDSVVSILIQGFPKCSGSFVGNHTVLTSSRCVDNVPTRDIRVKFFNNTPHRTNSVFNVTISTTLSTSHWILGHKISMLMIRDEDIGKDNTEIMEIPQQNDKILQSGSLTLFGWRELKNNGTCSMIFGSIELEIVSGSLCLNEERKKSGKNEFEGGEICARSSADNVPLSYLGGPVLQNGTQVAIASWYDKRSSLIICKGIADDRGKIEKEMNFFKSTYLE